MTDDQKKLLSVFEVRVRDLMSLCDQKNNRIHELEAMLEQKNEQLRQTEQMITDLNAKYDNMLTAKTVSVSNGDIKNARLRLSKLVREVDKCIALLNE